MYLIKSLGPTNAPIFPGVSVPWAKDQVGLVHASVIQFYQKVPATFEILAGPDFASVIAQYITGSAFSENIADLIAGLTRLDLINDISLMSGATAPVDYAAAIAATKVYASGGANNDLTATAKVAGAAGNAFTVSAVQGGIGAPLSVAYTAPNAVITLPKTAVAAASLVITSAGDNNNLTVTSVLAGAAGNSMAVEILQGVGVSVPASVVYSSGTATVTLGTTVGSVPDPLTAAALKVLWDASTADNLMTIAFEGDGSGNVTAAASANLTGGDDGTAIATSASTIKTAWDLSAAFAVMTLTFEGSGAGTVAAFASAPLLTGVDVVPGTGATVAGPGSQYTALDTAKLYLNGGTKAQPAWKIVTSA